MPSLSEFKTLYPEFEAQPGYTDALATALMARAQACLSEDSWGDLYSDGVYTLTGHMLALRLVSVRFGSGVSGPVVAEKLRNVSVTYANGLAGASSGDAGLARTQYGVEHIRLRDSLALGSLVL